MQSIKPELVLASLLAILAFVAVLVSEYTHNSYFLVAGAALAFATYMVYPPPWIVSLGKLMRGEQGDEGE